MRSQNLLLGILALIALFLAVGCNRPSEKEAYSAPFAVAQQEAASSGFSSESTLSSAQLNTGLDDVRFEAISEVLAMIESGRSTLSLIEAYEISVVFEAGEGSRFNPNTNQIVIDSNNKRFSAALILIHEVTHARYYHEGSVADVHLDGRQAYAHKKVEEEMVAVVSNIEAKMELAEVGVDTSDVQSALYYTYRQAYGPAIRAAKWDAPGSDEETLREYGREAGRSAVLEALLNGEALTSNTQESYRDYWGSEWDNKNDSL